MSTGFAAAKPARAGSKSEAFMMDVERVEIVV